MGTERRLVVHVLKDRYDVYVGRPMPRFRLAGSKWRNPSREWSADDYERYLLQDPLGRLLLADILELRGRILACWCAPKGGWIARRPFRCHGQVLAYYANKEPT